MIEDSIGRTSSPDYHDRILPVSQSFGVSGLRCCMSGLVGLIGVLLIALGWLFFGLFLTFYSMVVLPWLANNAPLLVNGLNQHPPMLAAYIAALLAEVAGIVLFAIPFVRARVHSRWVGYVLFASAFMTIGGIFIAPSGPATNIAMNVLSNLGPVLLMVAFGALGSRMWAEHVSTDHAQLRMHPSPA